MPVVDMGRPRVIHARRVVATAVATTGNLNTTLVYVRHDQIDVAVAIKIAHEVLRVATRVELVIPEAR